eukprot:gene11457-12654_t
MQHRIITDDVPPVNRRPYSIPHAWYKETEQQISEMLKNDIIRPSSSPWNAPVILVKKKDGSMRFISKCVFASHKVDFLGFELSKNGIQPQTRLTDAICSYERPLTKKQLKRFLGLAGFYRAFIPGFATISQPLNSLTSDTVVFKWSDVCENAFNQLKEQLLSEPVLQFPNLNQPFVIEVDASDLAVGGVLSQTGPDNQPHPVAYFSTALQKSQRNWSATDKEAYALVTADENDSGDNFLDEASFEEPNLPLQDNEKMVAEEPNVEPNCVLAIKNDKTYMKSILNGRLKSVKLIILAKLSPKKDVSWVFWVLHKMTIPMTINTYEAEFNLRRQKVLQGEKSAKLRA